jgi:hypothetical protein
MNSTLSSVAEVHEYHLRCHSGCLEPVTLHNMCPRTAVKGLRVKSAGGEAHDAGIFFFIPIQIHVERVIITHRIYT